MTNPEKNNIVPDQERVKVAYQQAASSMQEMFRLVNALHDNLTSQANNKKIEGESGERKLDRFLVHCGYSRNEVRLEEISALLFILANINRAAAVAKFAAKKRRRKYREEHSGL